MKQYAPLLLFLFFGTSAIAQFCINTNGNVNYSSEKVVSHLTPLEPIVNPPSIDNFTRVSNFGLAIGQGPNAFSVVGIRSNISAIKNLNTIAFIHRSDYLSNSDFTNGALRFDISFNGGNTWTNNVGPIWNPNVSQGNRPGPARFPNMAIYNADTNSNPTKSYITFFASTLNGDNDNWGGQLHGSYQHYNSTSYATADTSGNGHGWYVVNSDYEVAGSHAIGLNFSRKSNGIDFVFKDTLVVHKGVWKPNQHKFEYTNKFIPMTFGSNSFGEAFFLDAKVALDSAGSTGYISILGYSNNYHTYGVVHPIIYKTTNGGNTWSNPIIINLDSLVEQETNTLMLDLYKNADSNIVINYLSTGSEQDIIVDKYGNPHICVNIFPAGYNIVNTDGTIGNEFTIIPSINGIVDIYSVDGGLTWKSRVIGNPITWRGEFGVAPHQTLEENRPQIAKNDDGTKLFYFWFDTDPIWGTYQNIFPDAWMRGYDVDANEFIGGRHRITHSGEASYASVAPQVWDMSANNYKAHLVTQEINPNSNGDLMYPTQYVYYPVTYYKNISVQDHQMEAVEMTQNFPNPVEDITRFNVNVSTRANYKTSLVNLMGQTIYQKKLGTLSPGVHTIEMDLSNVAPGVYFYTVSTSGSSISKKLIVQ